MPHSLFGAVRVQTQAGCGQENADSLILRQRTEVGLTTLSDLVGKLDAQMENNAAGLTTLRVESRACSGTSDQP